MKANSFSRIVCFLLSLVIIAGCFVLPVMADEENVKEKSSAEQSLEEMKKYLDSVPYSEYLAKYTSSEAQIPAGDKKYSATFNSEESDGATVISEESWEAAVGESKDTYRAGSVITTATSSAVFDIEIETTGMYYLFLEYHTIAETVNSIERRLYIDGDLPFQEANMLALTKAWTYNYEDGENAFRKDLNGNDLTPAISQVPVWRSYFLCDPEGYTSEYYRFYLTAGKHTLTFDSIREPVVFGSVSAVPTDDTGYAIPTYEQYMNAVSALGAKDAPAEAYVHVNAETPIYVSDSAVTMTNNKSSAITEPSSPRADLYNVIGASSFNSVGQWAAYDFTVPETGLYELSLRYLQSALEGMFISRAIKLTSYGQGSYKYGFADGTPTVPFSEAYSTRYNFSKDWKVESVNGGGDAYKFFFEKGIRYTVYFEVSLGALASPLQRVENSMSVLNDCYLEILKLTGADPDEYNDYGFGTVMPDVMYDLNYEAVELQAIRDYFSEICGTSGSHLATLDNIIRLVATMATDETQIAANLDNLKTYLGTLGTWLSDSRASTLVMDFFEVKSPEKEPAKDDGNFFQGAWYEICAFFWSFFTDYDQMGVTNESAMSEDALNVWLALGRDQSKVVRNLIDSQFSDYVKNDAVYTASGGGEFSVSLKLVTAGTLLPSILAGKGPAVYMGLDATTLMNYAIRDAILPIEDLPGFNDVKTEFHQAGMDSVTLLGRSYGIPMTMTFAMMFYRKDFLVNMGVGVPQTWDELLSLLPQLQANNMLIGLNYVLALDFYLYQYGGNMWRYTEKDENGDYIYGDYQAAQIGLDTDEGLSAFEFCCGLYTDYSFPVAFAAANRFRTGEMPIVIQDYVATYNTLIVYATELDGLWSFSHIPGIRKTTDKDGNPCEPYVDYTAIADVTSAVVTKSGEGRREEAWEYIKWCTSANYTSEYSNRMVALLGPSAKYAAANMKALDDMSWTTSEVLAIKEQMDQLDAIVRFPGYYIVNRYTNFAFLAVVNNGVDPVESIREYIGAINTEVTRKREEFGMKILGTGEVLITEDGQQFLLNQTTGEKTPLNT